MVWWLRPYCASMRSWVQSLMDMCINIPCTYLVYKHVHHGESHEKNLLSKSNKKSLIFFMTCNFVMACCDKNAICDSMI